MSRFLITGGAGYIGSHTAKALSRAGHDIVVYDNLSRGHKDLVRWGPLIEGDIRDTRLMCESMRWFKPDAVIHFAAFAYVGESVTNPGLYYDNNVTGTLSLLRAMTQAGAQNLIVSSTCATYGQPKHMPITEETPQQPLNPYGQSKLMMEQMCGDFAAAHRLHYMALRYFNACGCDADRGISVREIIDATARVTGKRVPHVVSARRPGDPAVLVAAIAKSEAILGWKARHSDIDHIIATAWKWHQNERRQTRPD